MSRTTGASIRLAVFDLDGTLADSIAGIAAATNRVLLAARRAEHPLDAFRDFVGAGVTELICRAAPDANADQLSELEASFRVDYSARLLEKTAPFPGIAAALARLSDAGVALAVLSNKPDALTARMTAALFPDREWVAVLGHRDGIEKKPDPVALLEIASLAGIELANVAMVGDTPIDIETAARAGAVPFGVAWGFRPADELRQSGAAFVASSAAELADQILTIS